ncbi:ABC transporter permease [Catenulispora pinisilvae]|uniref:ABC transporter permease n=1 Tax=Catenulispora pinisilvae TaxID=2705253 RepID=UPI001891610C|nr:ABC transporter permease [Catenulispora pinisilvae]
MVVAAAAAVVFGALGCFVAGLARSEAPVVVRGASAADRVMRYLGTYQATGMGNEDAAVRRAARRFLGDVPGSVYRVDASRPLEVAGGAAEPFSDGAVVVTGPDIAGHATLTAGRWPVAQVFSAGTDTAPQAAIPLEVAVPDTLAGSFRLGPGSVLSLGGTGQLADPATTRSATVVGVYRVDDSALWQALPPAALPQTAARPAQVLVVAPDALGGADGLGLAGSSTWIVDPRLSGLSAARLSGLVDRADAAIVSQDARAAPGAAPISPAIIVSSALPAQRTVARRATLVGEAGLAVPIGVLILLAGTAMVRAARTVAARRRADVVLARSRGAGPVGVLGAAGLEGLGLGAVLVVVVPLVAPAAARLLGEITHIRDLTFPATGLLTVAIATAVGIAQAGLAVAAAWPDAVERFPGAAIRRRSARATRFQRAGTDLMLAGVAAWGLVQLDHYRSPLTDRISTQTVDAPVSLDPVLILVPAVVTGALAILVLRLLPLLARPLDRCAHRRRGLTGAFGIWQVSRRTARLTGALLLMVMAISVGSLALTATAMRARNVNDQAAFGIGADVRVDSSALPPSARHAAYTSVPGVTAATPLWSTPATTADGTHTATTLIGMDPRTAGAVLAFGPGTASAAAHNALARLGGTPLGGLPLPGRPVRLTVAMTTAVSDGALPAGSELELGVVDADGLTTTRAVPLTTGGAAFDLTSAGPLSYPLRVTSISALTPESPITHLVRIDVRAITGVDARGVPTGAGVMPAGGATWLIDGMQPGVPGAGSDTVACPLPVHQPEPGQESGGVLCRARASDNALTTLAFLTPGDNDVSADRRGPFTVSATLPVPLADGLTPALPAVVDQDLLKGTGTHVGDTVTLSADDSPPPSALVGADAAPPQLTLRITGVVTAVPGQSAGPAAILDLATLADQLPALGLDPPTDATWLLKAAPGSESEVSEAFAAHPELGAPVLRSAVAAGRYDVLRAGSSGLFAACVVLAPLFALLGFAMDTVSSVRERSRGLAALRAFGARPRELAAALLIEQALVAVLALVSGSVIGAGVAALTEPLLATSPDGSAALPAMAVLIPWLRTAALGLGTVVAVVAALSLIARAAAALDLARVLRAGDEL